MGRLGRRFWMVSWCSAKFPPGRLPDQWTILCQVGVPSPLCSGHREWASTTDPELARVPFGANAEPLLAQAATLATGLEAGATVVVIGDDSGWAVCSVAALLPEQVVIAVIDTAGPLGLAGCRRWLAASDAPGNLTAVVSEMRTRVSLLKQPLLSLTWLRFGQAPRRHLPLTTQPETLHALINPEAPIDLNRARIGKRFLSEAETKVLYWASRAVSVAYTAERTGYGAAEVITILAGSMVRASFVCSAWLRRWRGCTCSGVPARRILPLAEQTPRTYR